MKLSFWVAQLASETEIFCVFEGGGAKGVAHVGFLRAIDQQAGYQARGYAGTSAGAIVAALAAAGWKGRELFDHESQPPNSSAMDYLNERCQARVRSLADFLEGHDWSKLRWIKDRLNDANVEETGDQSADIGEVARGYLVKFLGILGVLLLAAFGSAALPFPFANSLSDFLWGTLVLLSLGSVVLVVLLMMYLSSRFSGLASMDRPRALLEALLRRKIGELSGDFVTFADIRKRTGHVLKIVAADLENGNLKLFSTESTPNESVAGAVVASAAIPMLFKPVELNGRQYCDGGIVSNLPAWTFDSERLNNEECLTITCAVSPPRDLEICRPKLRGLRLFTRVAVTSLFGGSDLNTRGMLRNLPVGAWHSIRMLDFEKTKEQVQLIQSSEEQAEIIFDLETRHRHSIEGLRAEIRKSLEMKGLNGCSLRVAYVRHVNLVDAPPAGYHLWNCAGFENYSDKGITLPTKDSLLGECIGASESRWFDLRNPDVNSRYVNVGSGMLADRLPKDRAWIAIVPLEENKKHGRVSVAVCVDCDRPLEDGEATVLPEIRDLVRKYA